MKKEKIQVNAVKISEEDLLRSKEQVEEMSEEDKADLLEQQIERAVSMAKILDQKIQDMTQAVPISIPSVLMSVMLLHEFLIKRIPKEHVEGVVDAALELRSCLKITDDLGPS